MVHYIQQRSELLKNKNERKPAAYCFSHIIVRLTIVIMEGDVFLHQSKMIPLELVHIVLLKPRKTDNISNTRISTPEPAFRVLNSSLKSINHVQHKHVKSRNKSINHVQH